MKNSIKQKQKKLIHCSPFFVRKKSRKVLKNSTQTKGEKRKANSEQQEKLERRKKGRKIENS